jgi:putative membrane protein
MLHYLQTLPLFLTWFPIAAAMLVGFGAIYSAITPWHELRLIRAGNPAAALSFSGAILGYALVLASVISGATSRADLLVWGAIGLVVQLLVLLLARLVLGAGLAERLEAGQASTGGFLGAMALAAGIINATTMLY